MLLCTHMEGFFSRIRSQAFLGKLAFPVTLTKREKSLWVRPLEMGFIESDCSPLFSVAYVVRPQISRFRISYNY